MRQNVGYHSSDRERFDFVRQHVPTLGTFQNASEKAEFKIDGLVRCGCCLPLRDILSNRIG